MGWTSPYYPMDNRVVVVRSTSVIPSSFVKYPVTGDHLSWSGTRLCADCVPCGTAELLLFATVCGLCSLRNGGAHAPCGRVQIRLQMGLLDFVNSADPFKVKIGERTLSKNEVPLITETEDRVISPSSQTISLVDHTIQDELNVNVGKRKKIVAFVSGSPLVKKAGTEGVVIYDSRPSTAGKSLTALRRLIRQSGQADTGSGYAAPAAEDATSSFVTPTLERASEGGFRDNVRTRPPSGRFVVLSSSSADTSIPTFPQVVSLISSAQANVNLLVTEPASDARTSFIPELEVGALSATCNNHM
ncbi:hypothetical protein Tco_1308784 [Tanacetum coccineum]